MNLMQLMVMKFHEAAKQTIGGVPMIRDAALRADLIEEEAKETVDAIRRGDLVGAVDGMCDLLYVTFGTAVSFGLNLWPFYCLVHDANMTKLDGPVRADGKRLKPPGFVPPDGKIRELLVHMGASL